MSDLKYERQSRIDGWDQTKLSDARSLSSGLALWGTMFV